VNLSLRSPTDSARLHLGATLFGRERSAQTASGFLPTARRDSIAAYLPSEGTGRKGAQGSKTEWTYCRGGTAPARVPARYPRAQIESRVAPRDKSGGSARSLLAAASLSTLVSRFLFSIAASSRARVPAYPRCAYVRARIIDRMETRLQQRPSPTTQPMYNGRAQGEGRYVLLDIDPNAVTQSHVQHGTFMK